jgi:thiol-disulfide isomerase/thioredoxin
MSVEEKKTINYFPTAIYNNKLYIGINEIVKLLDDIVNSKYNNIVDNKLNNININYENNIKQNNNIIIFLADWCSHCQHLKPELNEVMKNKNNIILVDSNNIPDKYKQYIQGFPTAIRESDNKVAVGGPNILNMIKENDNQKQNQDNLVLIYSNSCKYSQMIIPNWLEFKQYVKDKKLNINVKEFEKNELNNLEDYYKNKLTGFPTLFVNDKVYEGYDDIINYLNNLL